MGSCTFWVPSITYVCLSPQGPPGAPAFSSLFSALWPPVRSFTTLLFLPQDLCTCLPFDLPFFRQYLFLLQIATETSLCQGCSFLLPISALGSLVFISYTIVYVSFTLHNLALYFDLCVWFCFGICLYPRMWAPWEQAPCLPCPPSCPCPQNNAWYTMGTWCF